MLMAPGADRRVVSKRHTFAAAHNDKIGAGLAGVKSPFAMQAIAARDDVTS
jgi:hypothetical protein